MNALTIPMALGEIERRIDQGDDGYVTITGVHGVTESQRSADLLRIHNEAALVCPDGMPMVWSSRYAGYAWAERVYGPDLMLAACERSVVVGWRHFFYGGGDGVAPLLLERLVERFPGLEVVGTHTPPFRPLDDDEKVEVARLINDAAPDVVWVGLSTPKQERWMADFRALLDAPVLVGVGAAFDFHAGLVDQAPPRIQSLGLEWLYRLVKEPRRLWRRYLRNNPAFVAAIVADHRFRSIRQGDQVPKGWILGARAPSHPRGRRSDPVEPHELRAQHPRRQVGQHGRLRDVRVDLRALHHLPRRHPGAHRSAPPGSSH